MKYFTVSFLFIAIILSGCATSGGTLFKDVVKKSAAEPAGQSKTWTSSSSSNTDDTADGLTVTSDPTGSNVYIDGEFMGVTPLSLNLKTGQYRLTVKQEGYHKETRWIDYTEGDKRGIDITLKQITGYLYLEAVPPHAEITSNGAPLQRGVNELPVGTYQIEARLFGYIPYTTSVTIRNKDTTRLFINLLPAPFTLSELSVSRSILNPGNPSGLGQSSITFTVSSYGRGKLSILSPSHSTVLVHSFRHFDNWNQRFTWNGTDSSGKKLEDGTYTVIVSGESEDGTAHDRKTAFITIDQSFIIKARNVFSGVSGTLFTPTPDILPRGSFQFLLSSLGHADTSGYRFPSAVSFRAVPAEKLETDISGGIIIQAPADTVYFISLAAKNKIIKTKGTVSFGLSALVKGTYLFGTSLDTMHNFTGFTLGIPSGITFGAFSLFFTPELTVSPFQVSSVNETSPLGIYAWGYARGGILLDAGPVWTAVSASVRTLPFNEGFSMDYPVSAGWEVNWILPDTGIILSGYLTGAFDPDRGYYLNAGGGVGFIN